MMKMYSWRNAYIYMCVCVCVCAYMYVLVSQSCPTLCDTTDCSPPGSFLHGIPQSRILEWVAIPLSRASSWPRGQTQVSSIVGRFFTIWAMREALYMCIYIWNVDALCNIYIYIYISLSQIRSVAQSCPTLCDPMNCSTPGLPVHHQLLEFTQTHVHRVSDAIQPSHPLSSPSPPARNPS